MKLSISKLLPIFLLLPFMTKAMEVSSINNLRIATFNVSMEALNYSKNVKGDELELALLSGNQQIKNIAEIIQRINPDIILLNEFDFSTDPKTVEVFVSRFLKESQQSQKPVEYPYYYRAPVNTGIKTPVSLSNKAGISLPIDAFGFGFFPGHFGMLLLSKYPIDTSNIRTFQTFKWKDMPNALQPINPENNKPWYSKQAWELLRLSSKSHWDVPVIIAGTTIHILASHPTPPVFDGTEDRNGRRNHDEIRFWQDYISTNNNAYIYDDNGIKGGLKADVPFVILGDLNASPVEGDAIRAGINNLLNHPNIQDAAPQSLGGKLHSKENLHAENHTAYWRMRADYVLPSKDGFQIKSSGVFWPEKSSELYRLIKDRQSSSDHRLVWVDLNLH